MGEQVFIIKGEEIIWGPHDYPEALSDANLLCQSSHGEEIVFEFPPSGKIFENGVWRELTPKEKILNGELQLSSVIPNLKNQILFFIESKCEEGVEFNGHFFQARELDLNRMNNALKKIELSGIWNGAWRSRNNEWVALSHQELVSLALTCGAYWETMFVVARVMIDELPSLSKEDIANYDINAKWESVLNNLTVNQ
ncbi:DUF4376 domain-containing protein [Leptospira levettii]|uniref:DUF4376 domain-containing protein n=1 Tax=Leptospira levettii TaxID=2023178 RepID=UPI000C2B4147|nr:DUF4376 domain-containing protein [Leptospira levettii]PJZ87608.1 hypothetical protein CH368_15985 [Leptospira levettii]